MADGSATDLNGDEPGGRILGSLLQESGHLTEAQIKAVEVFQRSHSVRFGEAAVQLGFVSNDDVLRALSRQFNYAYGSEERQRMSPELVALNQPFSQQAEAFRMIRSQLLLRINPADGAARLKPRPLAVVSPNSGDGKTYFCANLAVALSQLGQRTIVVDADLRGPRLHEIFGVRNDLGLTGFLSGRGSASMIQQVPGVNGLFVCTGGACPPNPLELLERANFGLLLQELQSRFDHVIVDTAAAEHGADALVVSARCGQAMVLARKHASRLDAMQELTSLLGASNTTLTGVVMNDH